RERLLRRSFGKRTGSYSALAASSFATACNTITARAGFRQEWPLPFPAPVLGRGPGRGLSGQLFEEKRLRAPAALARRGMTALVAAVRAQVPRLAVVFQQHRQHLVAQDAPPLCVLYRNDDLHPPVQVARHPVRAADVDLLLA